MRKIFLSIFVVAVTAVHPVFLTAKEKPKSEPDKIVITAEDIEKMNVRTITELLNQIPGVSAGESSVKLRGSYMVRVLLDGRPINDLLSRHHAIKWDLVSLNSVERIEIYKGGGGVAFGDSTSGGAISITTKKIHDSSGNVEISCGNLNTENLCLNCQNSADIFGFGISAGWDKTDGYRENSDKDKKRAGIRINYESDEEQVSNLSLDYSREKRGYPGLPDFPTPNARAESETFSSIFTCKILKLENGVYFNRFEKMYANPDSNIETVLEGRSLGDEITTSFHSDRLGVINAGMNFEVAEIEGNKIESRQEEKYGIHASKDIRFQTLPLNLGLGLRMNFYSEFPEVVNPEIKLGFDSGNFSFQTAVRRTNNTPTFLQRYYETSTTEPNPDLGMEKAINYSVTLSHQPQKSFEEGVTLFLNEIEDRITYVRGDGGIGSYENLGEVTRKGVETSVKCSINDFLEIKPSYTYLIAKDERTGSWLSCSPKHRVKFDIRYEPIQKLALRLEAEYVSKQYTRSDNKESVSDYVVADFKVDFFLKRARLFLKVANLFDKDYFYGDGYPAPPRTWLTGASYEF